MKVVTRASTLFLRVSGVRDLTEPVSGAYLAYLVAPSPPSALTLTWWSAIWTVAVLGFEVFGTSPGKRAAGIRATRIDGHRPGAVHGLVRTGIKALSVGAFGVGCLWWADPSFVVPQPSE